MTAKRRQLVLAGGLTVAGLILILAVGSTPAQSMLDTGSDTWLYLPLVGRSSMTTTHHILLRPDNVFLTRSGVTYTEALTGPVSVQQQPLTTGAWNSPPGLYADRYTLTRGYSTYDLGDLSGRTVVSAAMELHLCSTATPPMESTTMTLYAGEWTGSVTSDVWDQVGHKLGTVVILPTHDIAAGDEWLTLLLDGSLPEKLRFIWKADESQAYPYNTSVGAAFDLADCYGMGNPSLTALHLWMRDE